MTPALFVAGAFAAYVIAVALIVGAVTLTDRDTETREHTPDDLMQIADAVQDNRPPVFVDEYLTARDFQLWQIEGGWVA